VLCEEAHNYFEQCVWNVLKITRKRSYWSFYWFQSINNIISQISRHCVMHRYMLIVLPKIGAWVILIVYPVLSRSRRVIQIISTEALLLNASLESFSPSINYQTELKTSNQMHPRMMKNYFLWKTRDAGHIFYEKHAPQARFLFKQNVLQARFLD